MGQKQKYGGFAECPYFEPFDDVGITEPGLQRNQVPTKNCMRLPARYNGDWALAFLTGLGMVRVNNHPAPPGFIEAKSIKLLHYSAGYVKPWFWWSRAFVPMTCYWTDMALSLDTKGMSSSLGYGGRNEWMHAIFLSLFPILLILMLLVSLQIGTSTPQQKATVRMNKSKSTATHKVYAHFTLRSMHFVRKAFDSFSQVAIFLPPYQVTTSSLSASATISSIICGVIITLISVSFGVKSVKPSTLSPGPGWSLFFSHAIALWSLFVITWMKRCHDAGYHKAQTEALYLKRKAGKDSLEEQVLSRAKQASFRYSSFIICFSLGFIIYFHTLRGDTLGDLLPTAILGSSILLLAIISGSVHVSALWFMAGYCRTVAC